MPARVHVRAEDAAVVPPLGKSRFAGPSFISPGAHPGAGTPAGAESGTRTLALSQAAAGAQGQVGPAQCLERGHQGVHVVEFAHQFIELRGGVL